MFLGKSPYMNFYHVSNAFVICLVEVGILCKTHSRN